jgi:hypothetical protein
VKYEIIVCRAAAPVKNGLLDMQNANCTCRLTVSRESRLTGAYRKHGVDDGIASTPFR